jgi:hypothetical protein
MNKWLLLLVVVGLGVAGWLHRDTISGWLGQKSEGSADGTPGAATPNPASASIELAKKTYPALGVPSSQFNIQFLKDYNQVKASSPGFLAQADWPMQLANRVASELGVQAGAPATPKPVPFGSSLDNKAYGSYGNGSAPHATPQLLPGLIGSDLDQKPKSTRTH